MIADTRSTLFPGVERVARHGPEYNAGRHMTTIETSTWATKVGLARMLAGGVIMDVVTADHARIATTLPLVAAQYLAHVSASWRRFWNRSLRW